MRTAVISDLHLGLGSGADLLRREPFLERLLGELERADRLVLLGDVLELRDRPLAEVLDVAGPVLAQLAEAVAGRELVIVPGNHDHHLIETWLERRGLDGAAPLELEQRGTPQGLAFEALANHAAAADVSFAYPGLWLRDDVYATHGHYLDRHLTVPTIERLGVGLVERVLGVAVTGADPLAPPDSPPRATIEEYERVQTPVYALLYGLAQATVGDRPGGANPSARLWQMMGGGESRGARVRGWLLGSVAVPGAVGVANRLGLGPVRADLSAERDRPSRLRGDGRRGRRAWDRGRAHRLWPHPSPGRPRARRWHVAVERRQLGALPRAARRHRRREPVLARDPVRGLRYRRARVAPPARRPQPRRSHRGLDWVR